MITTTHSHPHSHPVYTMTARASNLLITQMAKSVYALNPFHSTLTPKILMPPSIYTKDIPLDKGGH